MNYELFRAELQAAKISGREFCRLLKLNENSLSNYKAAGEVPSHLAIIAGLIRHLHEHDIDYMPVFERIPIERKKARGKPGIQKSAPIADK